jgi:hypothetical protein
MAQSVLQLPAVPDNETCITFCKRCGLRTRHERQRWQRRFSLLSWLTGRVQPESQNPLSAR